MIRTIPTCLLVACALVVTATATHAAATPEQECQKGRYDAAAKYAQCEQKVNGKFFAVGFGVYEKFLEAVSKCRVKYTDTWTKLHKKALDTGATCDAPRFTIGIGVTQDNLTGLQWEQKTDNGDVHDKDNRYTWSTGGALGNGTVFTTFLASLNTGSCYLGTCDWRLPTKAELQTILSESYPCTTSPCIEGAVGMTADNGYWSATPLASNPGHVWAVYLFDGFVGNAYKGSGLSVRAVRAGL